MAWRSTCVTTQSTIAGLTRRTTATLSVLFTCGLSEEKQTIQKNMSFRQKTEPPDLMNSDVSTRTATKPKASSAATVRAADSWISTCLPSGECALQAKCGASASS